MKKIFIPILLLLLGSFAFADLTGLGTPEDPYMITSCLELQSMQNDLTASYALSGDIDCSDTANWTQAEGTGFVPIGDSSSPFEGNFYGMNYTISGLYMSYPTSDYIGLFGVASGSTIQGGHIAGFYVEGNAYIGGLIGAGTDVSVQGTTFQGIVIANYKAGGVAGSLNTNVNLTSDINDIYASITMAGTGENPGFFGGIAGSASSCAMDHVFPTVDIQAGYNAGGIAGYAENCLIHDSNPSGSVTSNASSESTSATAGAIGYASGSIIRDVGSFVSVQTLGQDSAGGLIGVGENTNILRSWVDADVSGTIWAGGIIGFSLTGNTIDQSFASGTFSINTESLLPTVGGLVGASAGVTINDSYVKGHVSRGDFFALVGGLVGGALDGYTDINNSLFFGTLSGGAYPEYNGGIVGGFVTFFGSPDGEIDASMWDTTVSQVETGVWIDGAVPFYFEGGRSTAELNDINTYLNSGRDIIGSTGLLNNGYPYLARENYGDLSGAVRQIFVNYVDLLSYMADWGPIATGSLAHQYRLEYSSSDTGLSNMSLTLYGDIDIADVTISGATIDEFVNGEYIRWYNVALDGSGYGETFVTINHSDEGIYVYTASIAASGIQSLYNNNQEFTITSTVAYPPYVLTEITPIPSTITTDTATYYFSISGTGESQYISEMCGGSSEASLSDMSINPELQMFVLHNLTVGETYECDFAVQSLGGYSNQLTVGPFTVVAPSHGGGGGGSTAVDYCPNGDNSGSYYDSNCGSEKSLAERVIAKLTNNWTELSTEKIAGMLETLTLLNEKIQAKENVSLAMKQLFQAIIDGLIAHYNQ